MKSSSVLRASLVTLSQSQRNISSVNIRTFSSGQVTFRTKLVVNSSATFNSSFVSNHDISCYHQKRSLTKSANTDFKGVSLYHVKYYLKNKSISFTETHPCLKLSLPSYVFGGHWSTEWSKLNESITCEF